MSVPRAIAESLLDVHSDATVRERLGQYVALLLERNAQMNLTAARDPAAVAEHLRDSLAVAPFVCDPLVDVGSGGGFPGIALAIATGFSVTLVESVAKKAKFLSEVVAALDLPVRVLCARAEDAGRNPAYRAKFASATARAVSSAPTVLELTVPLLALGGIAVLQRGRLDADERIAAADAALVLGAEVARELALDARSNAETSDGNEAPRNRCVLIVRKIAATGPRFPRRAGVPEKRPLCYEPGTTADV